MASQSIIIANDGTIVNPNSNSFTGENSIDLTSSTETNIINQISLIYFDDLIVGANGISTIDKTSVVTTGLSGTLTITVKTSNYSAYPVTLPDGGVVDISDSCEIAPFSGTIGQLVFAASSIVGCNYILVIVRSK